MSIREVEHRGAAANATITLLVQAKGLGAVLSDHLHDLFACEMDDHLGIDSRVLLRRGETSEDSDVDRYRVNSV